MVKVRVVLAWPVAGTEPTSQVPRSSGSTARTDRFVRYMSTKKFPASDPPRFSTAAITLTLLQALPLADYDS